jgi:hypothetical protein
MCVIPSRRLGAPSKRPGKGGVDGSPAPHRPSELVRYVHTASTAGCSELHVTRVSKHDPEVKETGSAQSRMRGLHRCPWSGVAMPMAANLASWRHTPAPAGLTIC